MAGYSGTPLAKKLGIKEGSQVLLLGAPDTYRDLLAPLPEGVEFAPHLTDSTDIVHIFSTRRPELHNALLDLRSRIKPAGTVWVSWPKKSTKVPTDITEDTVREIALPLGFVDVKVCAVDDVWSGLKLVIRKELR
ncbi:MAG TPA: DUF3052 family protein [Thermoanaerobaculia bacterium]|nr:DUF3052 family protein [Thermoanaerobaculia bacterium]